VLATETKRSKRCAFRGKLYPRVLIDKERFQSEIDNPRKLTESEASGRIFPKSPAKA
jgi:hypothetical protein